MMPKDQGQGCLSWPLLYKVKTVRQAVHTGTISEESEEDKLHLCNPLPTSWVSTQAEAMRLLCIKVHIRGCQISDINSYLRLLGLRDYKHGYQDHC